MVLTSGPQWSPGGQLASAAGRSGLGRTCEHNNVEGRHDGGDLAVWRLSAEARKIQWRGGKMRVKLRSRRHASRGAAQASPATRLAAPFTVVSLLIAVGYCRPRPVNGFLSPGQKKESLHGSGHDGAQGCRLRALMSECQGLAPCAPPQVGQSAGGRAAGLHTMFSQPLIVTGCDRLLPACLRDLCCPRDPARAALLDDRPQPRA